MEIYILRHGVAEEGGPGMRDADRRLVPEGKDKLRQVLRRAREAGVRPNAIITSPYIRAVETARMAAGELDFSGDLYETEALVPESSPQLVWDELRIHRDAPQVLLAGHEPLLGAVYAYLLDAPTLRVDVKKGSLGRIDVSGMGARPRGVLRWIITARTAGSLRD